MWTRSAANKETGKFKVACTDFHGELFFSDEFDTIAEADEAGASAERRMTMWEMSGRAQTDNISDDDLLAELA